MPAIDALWVYLSASPLLGLTVTLLAYQLACLLHRRTGGHPLANPVLIAITLLGSLLLLTDTSYEHYFEGAQFVHFLLGPATVALAVPLYLQVRRLKRLLFPIACGLIAGSLTAIVSAVAIARFFGASEATQISLAPKSVTTPIAMGIADSLGGIPSLTAVMVLITGVLGAVMAQRLFRWLKIDDPAVQGLAMGVASHGIGTARAFQLSEQTGAFAALAMGLNGLLTAALLPVLARWLL